MDVSARDVGNSLKSFPAAIDHDATAGSTGDNTKVTGNEMELLGKYQSAKIVIAYKTTLGSSETLSYTVAKIDSNTSGAEADSTAVLAKTVVETGTDTGTEGVYEIDVDLSSWKKYAKLEITPDLSASGTDTVTWSAVLVALKQVP